MENMMRKKRQNLSDDTSTIEVEEGISDGNYEKNEETDEGKEV